MATPKKGTKPKGKGSDREKCLLIVDPLMIKKEIDVAEGLTIQGHRLNKEEFLKTDIIVSDRAILQNTVDPFDL